VSDQEPRRPLMRRVAGWVTNLVLAAVTAGALAWLAPSVLGYERYVITGGSMSGTFERGSLAFEKEVPVEQLAVGDVITYLPPASAGTTDLVTHRIVRITRDPRGRAVFRTRGDANGGVDPWTFRLQQPTQPVVQFTVPYAGHALIALADRETRRLLIGGPATLIALIALLELVRALARRDPAADPVGHPAPTEPHPSPSPTPALQG
jgi:signal peptidase I